MATHSGVLQSYCRAPAGDSGEQGTALNCSYLLALHLEKFIISVDELSSGMTNLWSRLNAATGVMK